MTGHFLVHWLAELAYCARAGPHLSSCSSSPAARWNRLLTFESMKGNAPHSQADALTEDPGTSSEPLGPHAHPEKLVVTEGLAGKWAPPRGIWVWSQEALLSLALSVTRGMSRQVLEVL